MLFSFSNAYGYISVNLNIICIIIFCMIFYSIYLLLLALYRLDICVFSVFTDVNNAAGNCIFILWVCPEHKCVDGISKVEA